MPIDNVKPFSIYDQAEQDDTQETTPEAATAAPDKPFDLRKTVDFAASHFGVDPDVLAGMLMKESALRPDVISGSRKSSAGATGIAQFMPETAKRYGVDPTDPVQSIFGMAAYMRDNLRKFDGDYDKAVAAYNWGENRKAFASEDWLDQAPEETRDYVDFVRQFADAARSRRPSRPLPAGVKPSDAGGGRGSLGAAQNVYDAQQRAGVQPPAAAEPFSAPANLSDETGSMLEQAQEPPQGPSVFDRATPQQIEDAAPKTFSQAEGLQLSKGPQQLERERLAGLMQRSIESAGSMRNTSAVDAAANATRSATGSDALSSLVRESGDLYLSASNAMTKTAKLGADIAQLFGADEMASRVFEAASQSADEQKSSSAQATSAGLAQILQDDNAGPGDVVAYLLSHPSFVAQQVVESGGSMGIAVGGARATGALMAGIAARYGGSAQKVAAAYAAGTTLGAAASNAFMNAGDTFDQTGADTAGKYQAALVSFVGTLGVDALTGGGAEGVIARGGTGFGRRTLDRLRSGATVALKEGVEEGGEQIFNTVGQQIGEGGLSNIDPAAALRQAAVDATIGAATGAGTGAVQVSAANAPTSLDYQALARSKGFLSTPGALSEAAGLTPIVNPGAKAAVPALAGSKEVYARAQSALDGLAAKSGVQRQAQPQPGVGVDGLPDAVPARDAGESSGAPQGADGVPESAQPAVDGRVAADDALNDRTQNGNNRTQNENTPTVWFGRRGDGYVTQADAQQALPGRERRHPDLDWRVEPMPSGKFRLAGYARSEQNQQRDTNAIPAGETRELTADEFAAASAGVAGGVQGSAEVVRGGLEAAGAGVDRVGDGGVAGRPTGVPAGGAQATARAGNAVGPAPVRSLSADVRTAVLRRLERSRWERSKESVVLSEVPAGASEAHDAATSLANHFGVPLMWVRVQGQTRMRGANIQTPDGSVMVITENASDAPVAIATHEIVHGMPEHIKRPLIDAVMATVSPEQRQQFLDDHEPYKGLESNKQDEELTAVLAQAEARRPEFWSRLAEKMPEGSFKSLAKYLLGKLDAITGLFPAAKSSKYTSDIKAVREALTTAYAQLARERGAATPESEPADGEAQFSEEGREYKLSVEREARDESKSAGLSQSEREAIERDGAKLKLTPKHIEALAASARETRKRFPVRAGWAPIEVRGLVAEKDADGNVKTDKSGQPKVSVDWQKIPYGFNVPPGKDKAPSKIDEPLARKVADSFTRLVRDVFDRAKAGDRNAQIIVAHQAWYRNVTEVLRREFGSQGDLLADLLGATSPNTPVDTNWRFSIDILRRLMRGEFDAEMKRFVDFIDAGGKPTQFKGDKIRQASGRLYGMNSGNAMIALANLWRNIEPGTAPKARNFALNLIGQSKMATIDVWAARMLRRAADMVRGMSLPRIPTVAEQGVTGNWNAKADAVTGEFGFGARVMDLVAEDLKKHGIDMTPPDIQALAWFAEKELWTRNNWTSVQGEGGSFEENIESTPAERYMLGFSVQQGEKQPEEGEVSSAQARLLAQMRGDDTVISARVLPTYGVFFDKPEEALDVEWVAERGKHNPALVLAEAARLAKEHNQMAIFVSRVLRPTDDNTNARPGAEVYFRKGTPMQTVKRIMGSFTSRGLDGFTLSVDPRSKPSARPGQEFIGVRIQYVPEFDDNATPGTVEALLVAKRRALNDAIAELGEDGAVAYAAVYKYDTLVIGKDQYDGFIDQGTSRGDRAAGGQVWPQQSVRQRLEGAAARITSDAEPVDRGRVPDAGDAGRAIGGEQFSEEPARRAVEGPVQQSGAVRGSAERLAAERRPYQGARRGTVLEGLPTPIEVDGRLIEFAGFRPAQDAARAYMQRAGLPYRPATKYAKINRSRAKLIADEFARMPNAPSDPLVQRAYQAMIDETVAQYREILKTGLKVEFIDYAKTGDPYGNPRNAILDVVRNNHLWVFSTRDGFGSDDSFDPSANPLLQETEFQISGRPALANDVFRVVHDYFGHVKDGVGFRAEGEENAWRSHAAMYSPLARRAMTVETRGQNSWVNFGPHAEKNRTANGADTVYADQKVGLLPEWVSEEGATDFSEAPYSKAPDSLMGFRKGKPNKGFAEERYKHVEFVRVTWPDGDSMLEAQRGLNRAHALERARRNWSDAEISRVSRDEAMREDADLVREVDSQMGQPQFSETPNDVSPIGFYSALSRALRNGPGQAPAEQWRAYIKGLTQKGIKAEEIEWSGINDWLGMQTGKVPKQAVADFLSSNGVQVTETVLSDDGYMLDDQGRRIDDGIGGFVRKGMPTRYGQYTLPGGTNYREILLTLPERKTQAQPNPWQDYKAAGWTVDLDYNKWTNQTSYTVRDADGDMVTMRSGAPGEWTADMALEDYAKSQARGRMEEERRRINFTQSHWDQPNVLAHIRLNDRTDADGKRVLFVEEIQSDWGQKGKKQGFALPITDLPADVTIKPAASLSSANSIIRAAASREYARVVDAAAEAGINGADAVMARFPETGERLMELDHEMAMHLGSRDMPDEADFKEWLGMVRQIVPDAFQNLSPYKSNHKGYGAFRDGQRIAWAPTESEARTHALEVLRYENTQKPPAAPFVTKTDSWVALAMKRVIKMAVDEGYDKVAFVTGEQSAERYDLSKQVDSISTGRVPDQPGAWQVIGRKDGKVLIDTVADSDAKLAETVGKELAEKVIERGGGMFKGVDLKVGGEGMRAFYDKIVPSVGKDVLRKVGGGQLTTVSFSGAKDKGWATGEQVMDYMGMPHSAWAELSQRERNDLMDEYRERTNEEHTQPGFDITDKMRETAGEGLPMFSEEPGERPRGFDLNSIRRPTPAPMTRETEGWILSRDATGRLRFGAGAKLYRAVANVANSALDVVRMKPMSTELKRALRVMKREVDQAMRDTAAVANEMKDISEGDRELISDIIEKELAAGVNPPKHILDMAATISALMGKQTDDLIEVGMLSPEAAEKWRDKYLPRFYAPKLGQRAQDAWDKAVRLMRGKPQALTGIGGKSLLRRGMTEVIEAGDLKRYQEMGWTLDDPGYQEGVSERVQVHRDFTRAEREKMGEIRDAMFRFVMGYMRSQRDLALGRLYAHLAETMASRHELDGYVRVPDTRIDGTDVNSYGKLAGLYVPREVLDHLSKFGESEYEAVLKVYRKALGLWKEGKTALNPVSHFNNVVGNLTFAHFAGVSYWDVHKYAGAIHDFFTNAPMLQEAREAGVFGGTISQEELQNLLPKEMQVMAQMQKGPVENGVERVWNMLSLFLRKPLGTAYEAEDLFFRYLLYKDARQRGLHENDAIDHSQRYIFTYDDLPKGARIVRDTALPFFSWTYKAVPVLAFTAMEYPWRYAAPAAALYAINAAMYAIAAGGDDEDWQEKIRRYVFDKERREKANQLEADERKNLPPWMKGNGFVLGTPKAIRLGVDDLTQLPLFMDVSRIVPGGDMLDVVSNTGGIPWLQNLTPSNPVLNTLYAMQLNRDPYFGKDVVDANDTSGEAAKKRGEWLWQQFAPAIAVNNYIFNRSAQAVANATGRNITWWPEDFTGIGKDGLAVQPKYAAMQNVGIKVRPIDLDMSAKIDASHRRKLISDIEAEIRSLRRQNSRGALSDESVNTKIDLDREKINRLKQGLDVDGNEKD